MNYNKLIISFLAAIIVTVCIKDSANALPRSSSSLLQTLKSAVAAGNRCETYLIKLVGSGQYVTKSNLNTFNTNCKSMMKYNQMITGWSKSSAWVSTFTSYANQRPEINRWGNQWVRLQRSVTAKLRKATLPRR